jgi:hypothetical protein
MLSPQTRDIKSTDPLTDCTNRLGATLIGYARAYPPEESRRAARARPQLSLGARGLGHSPEQWINESPSLISSAQANASNGSTRALA